MLSHQKKKKPEVNFIIKIIFDRKWQDIHKGGDYKIPVSRDEILSRFAGIPAVL